MVHGEGGGFSNTECGQVRAFSRRLLRAKLVFAGILTLLSPAYAQNAPHIGYVYPAGGQAGTTFQIVVGGQYLGSVSNAFVSGSGVEAKVVECNRPMSQKEFTDLRDKLKELQDKRQANRKSLNPTNAWTTSDEVQVEEIKAKILKNPPNRQGNPALAETVTVEITIATNAALEEREIRLATPNGLSNPLVFCIGQLPEVSETAAKATSPEVERILERLGRKPAPAKSETRITLPATVNGQITPGGVDRYRFSARKGQRIVALVSARALIPYIPDAVPGWFQATLALSDAKGKELAYADDFRFNPDPALAYDILRDGEYTIEIKDAIYRGREDFVYRIAIGELPFVTNAFPLGGPAGTSVSVEMSGWNLSTSNVVEEVNFTQPGIYQLKTTNAEHASDLTPFAVDTLPECREQEPNDSPTKAQHVALPIIVNGRIGQPGDSDVFSFNGNAGDAIVAEVNARRLNSPVDSVLRLTDASGTQIAFNDDYEDKGAGLETHHADSYLHAKLPADGIYYVHLADSQRQGGPEFGYRLRLSAPRPNFALRVVPSSVSVRPGGSVPLTVFAFRKDGFTNSITLKLNDAPDGFRLSGAQVPAGEDKIKFTLTAPAAPFGHVAPLSLQGWAMIDGAVVLRPAVPAEDMMQAFAYRHLVPSKELAVAVGGRGMPSMRILSDIPVKLPVGGAARIRVGPVGPKFNDNFHVEASEPPDGITLSDISTRRGEVEIELRCDAKVKADLKGNLIISAFFGRAQTAGKAPGGNRRTMAGTLPAIPFEVVSP